MADARAEHLRGQERAIQEACLEQLATRPVAKITIHSIALASKLEVTAGYRAARRLAYDCDHLMRKTYIGEVSEIGSMFLEEANAPVAVSEVLSKSIASMASIMLTDRFIRATAINVRQGAFYEWIVRAYTGKIIGNFCKSLEEAVFQAGENSGSHVFLHQGAAARAFHELQWQLVMPKVIPTGRAKGRAESEIVRSVTRQVVAEAFTWDVAVA